MRTLAAILALLTAATLLVGCTPARIVEAQGPRVTYAWSAERTTIARVNRLAISYCSRWNAPPWLLADEVDGNYHRTTFVCRPRETLPLRRLF